MGVSTQPSLDFMGNGGIRHNPSGHLTQGRKQMFSTVIKKGHIRRRRRISMDRLRKTRLQSCSIKPAQKRIRTLRKLVPTRGSTGLDGLFREAADYIVSLQVRVKAMQVMVNILSCSDE